MTRLTALIIQSRGDDIVCTAGGPNKNGKFSGWIELYRNGEFDHALLSSEPVYTSEEVATEEMRKIVKQVRSAEL